LLLLSELPQPAKTADVRDLGYRFGRRDITKWNLSDILKKAAAAGLVAQLPEGWRLLPAGRQFLAPAGLAKDVPIVLEARHNLQNHLATVTDANKRAFLEEALGCFEGGFHRAAIVLSWIGAMSIIHEHVVERFLVPFSQAGAKRFKDFKAVKGIKDMAALKESDLLQICQDCGMLDKAEKQELGERLDLRNRCGHPNSLKLAEHTVASHIEILMHNVYSRY
jgi:hypothetical protein